MLVAMIGFVLVWALFSLPVAVIVGRTLRRREDLTAELERLFSSQLSRSSR